MQSEPGTLLDGDELSAMNVDRALDAAIIVMENGGYTKLAERTFNRIYGALEKSGDAPSLSGSVWRSDFLAITITSAAGGSKTFLRRVSGLGMSLGRASEAVALGDRAARGELDADAVAGEIDRIRKMPAPYGRWMMLLAAACAAAFLTQTAAGDYGSMGVAFVAAGAGSFFRSILQARKRSRSFHTFAAALLSLLLATAGLRLGLSASAAATFLGSIIYLVPGIGLATGFVDLVSDRHMLAGVERIISAAYTFLLLAFSVVIAEALL